VNTFWLSFYQTQNHNVEINDAVFFQGVLKILAIIRPYITPEAFNKFINTRETYIQHTNIVDE
jgi:hypothetical protein